MTLLTRKRLTPVILILSILAFEMSTDLYVPCLPEMIHFFKVDEATGQLTLSAYLIGFGLLGCLSGPLSDSYGRRGIIHLGLLIFLLGSVACWLSHSMVALVASRLLQGIGAGIAIVVAMAMVKDMFDDEDCSKILSTMGMVIALSPMVAPIFGGMIAEEWGWMANFSIIAIVAIFVATIAWIFLPESLEPCQRVAFSSKETVLTYLDLMKRPQVFGFALISGITYGGLWAWIAEAPFYMIEILGMDMTVYGYYAAIGPGAYIAGTFFNQKLVTHFGVDGMLKLGLRILLPGSIALLCIALVSPHNLILIYGAVIVYGFGLAPVFANAATKSIDVPPSVRGVASALLSTIEMGCAAISASLMGFFSTSSLIKPALVMFISSILCAVLFMMLSSSRQESVDFN
jgi:DHA1 family bicyclomycin/chloramphenicol resistance-like MFS transporter